LRLRRADVPPPRARARGRGRGARRLRLRGPPARGRGVKRAVALGLAAVLALATSLRAEGPPQRVASLNLASDEALVDILPPERLVGVTRWADDPETSMVAGRIPASVYRFPKADMERLVALRPDLVIVSEFHDADFLGLFQKSGLRYHRMQGQDSLAGIRAA